VQDGHLEITELIPVPQDFIGLSPLRHSAPITDPRLLTTPPRSRCSGSGASPVEPHAKKPVLLDPDHDGGTLDELGMAARYSR